PHPVHEQRRLRRHPRQAAGRAGEMTTPGAPSAPPPGGAAGGPAKPDPRRPLDWLPVVTTHLLYLHGFRSSPQSTKARQFAAWLAAHRPEVHWWCPQLPPSPRAALQLALDGVAAWPRERLALAGSSLGGVCATVLAERLA